MADEEKAVEKNEKHVGIENLKVLENIDVELTRRGRADTNNNT